MGPLLLGVVVAAGAAFERAAFPDRPTGTALLTVNPAHLAGVDGAVCGQLGHDRPFGLRQLAGHHVLLAPRRLGPLRLGGGGAQRGPARHRERVVWIGIGAAVPGVWLGGGVQLLSVSRAGARDRWGPAPMLGMRIAVGRDWGVEGWARDGIDGWAQRRWAVRLAYAGTDGSLAAGAVVHGRRARLQVTLSKPLGSGVGVGLEVTDRPRQFGVAASLRRGTGLARLEVRSHSRLGATPSWVVGRACR